MRTFLLSFYPLSPLLQPKRAGMPKQQGSKTPARLGADAKEQAGTANCLQTAQQKLTQLPDNAGTNARRLETHCSKTTTTPSPRSTKRSTTCRCWSPAHKRRKAPADEHTLLGVKRRERPAGASFSLLLKEKLAPAGSSRLFTPKIVCSSAEKECVNTVEFASTAVV